MSPQEVVIADAQRNGKSPGVVMGGIALAIDTKGARVMHDNKSVVVLEPIEKSKSDFQVHLFTVDSPVGLVRSVKSIVAQIEQIPGLERVYGDTKDKQVIQMLRTAGVAVQKSDKPKFTWMAEA
jgi:hypothetical protein